MKNYIYLRNWLHLKLNMDKETSKVTITEFTEALSSNFTSLNLEWLEKYFEVEEVDKEVLNNPKAKIIDQGGKILFALINQEVVGTVALIKKSSDIYELSKMAVTNKYQGMRIGQKLIYASIYYAGNIGCKRLYLDSNTTLKPAISLYKKVGFKEIERPKNSAYNRSDIRMELYL